MNGFPGLITRRTATTNQITPIMKMKEYFQNLPVGEVVNKRGLAYLKRLGFIWDYSPWGYLESLRIYGKKREGEPFRDELTLEISPKRNCKAAERYNGALFEKYRQCGRIEIDKTLDELLEMFGTQGSFEFNGITFRPRYFDGCFKPYLVKDGPANGRQVTHRMSLWGAVI